MSNQKFRIIHIHGQRQWHDDAYIISNRPALEKLREMIEEALQTGKSTEEFMPQDGECFDLHIVLDDSDWQSDTWKRRALPYTDEVASLCSNREEMIYPWDEISRCDKRQSAIE